MAIIKHVAFRYFLVPIEAHLFTKPVAHEALQGWLRETLFSNLEFTTDTGIEYAIRIKEAKQAALDGIDGKNVIIGKISRKKFSQIFEKTEDDIKMESIEDWPFIGFICDMRKQEQIFIVERDAFIARTLSTFKKHIEEIANQRMFAHGYSLKFELIIKDQAFWKIADSADGIYGVHFKLHSPNLFGAGEKATESLKKLQAIFNNNTLEVDLINDKANLKLPSESVRDYQEYADKGGGSWKLTIMKHNRRRIHKSYEQAHTVTLEAEESADPDTLIRALHEVLDWVNKN
jgi:hypothetical protein